MNKKVLGLVAAVVIVGLVVALATTKPTPTPTPQPSLSPTVSPVSNSTGSPQVNALVVIEYDDNGFSPAQTTLNAGRSITFTNRSSGQIQVDSNPHPAHTDNPELNAGIIREGESKTVKVTTKGSFGIHNHLNPIMKASVTIQ